MRAASHICATMLAALAASGCYRFHTASDSGQGGGGESGARRGGSGGSSAFGGAGANAGRGARAGTGGTGGTGGVHAPDASVPETCSVHAFKAGQKFDPVDMVWVVDSSRSMADEQTRIQQTINDFVSAVEARHFDVRLVMVTASNIVPAPLGTDAARYRFVQRSVGSHDALAALLDELPSYRDFLRPSAALHFVVVTDDDSNLAADQFLERMDAELGRPFVVHAVASPDVDGAPCRDANATGACTGDGRQASCGAAAIGREYYALAERLGGQEISICVDDWRKVFGPLLEAVGRTEVPCIVDLTEPVLPDTQVTLLRPGAANVRLNEVARAAQCGQERAYYILEQALATRLVLCPVACGSTTVEDVELRITIGCSLH
jgi:hypothetical protein